MTIEDIIEDAKTKLINDVDFMHWYREYKLNQTVNKSNEETLGRLIILLHTKGYLNIWNIDEFNPNQRGGSKLPYFD